MIEEGIKIRAIDIANGEWNDYCSQRECARELGLAGSSINKCLKGKRRHVGGYVFKYAD